MTCENGTTEIFPNHKVIAIGNNQFEKVYMVKTEVIRVCVCTKYF